MASMVNVSIVIIIFYYLQDGQLQKPGKHGTEVLWVGSATALKKKRKHYQSFQRNGVKISVCMQVFVLYIFISFA